MKLHQFTSTAEFSVASFAEAWIEIENCREGETITFVASFAEAWIEIFSSSQLIRCCRSPPSRRRGLKSNGVYTVGVPEPSPPSRRRGLKFKLANVEEKKIEVASFAEAWIEILIASSVSVEILSPPSRRRGLKSIPIPIRIINSASPPSRRRGLKYE